MWVNLRELYVYNGNINKIPAPLKIASKRVCENLFTHKASGSNFNKVNFTAWTCLIFGSSDRKILANERAETCLHAQRVQQNLQEVNVRPLVRRSLGEWLTEEVPHHPKIKQTVQVATPFRLRDVAPQLVNKEKVDWNSRVPEPFGSFQMKRTYRTTWRKYKWTIKVEDCRLISYLRRKIIL